MQGNIFKIESMGLSDGPGVRTVIFFQGCKLRCKFCHNPESWNKNGGINISVLELVNKIKRFKNYYGEFGGVTLSGGEPLLQSEFVLKLCKELKKEHIHIVLDTAGIGNTNPSELLKYIDLVILDIKHVKKEEYFQLTSNKIDDTLNFIKYLNLANKPVWIRQVIIPNYNDNKSYMHDLKSFILNIKNVKNIELLPFHNMAIPKYKELNIPYNWKYLSNMDKEICLELETYLKNLLKSSSNI